MSASPTGPGRRRRGPHILVDATAVPADRGGVGRYLDSLLAALDAQGADLTVVCQARDLPLLRRLVPGGEVVAAPARVASRPVRFAWEQAGLPLLARRVSADVLHSPHYTMPLAAGRPRVVTAHDATFFTDPDLHLGPKVRIFRAATRVAVHRAARVVVPSLATRDELVRLLGADPARFAVIPHGVDHAHFRPPAPGPVAALAERLGVPRGRPYVAFLGTIEPRKNVPALIRGWAAAVHPRDEPPPLVLAGAAGWDVTVAQTLQSLAPRLRPLVRLPGYLAYEDLPTFLGGAAVVAYPSLGEGFGLPVLEAMACGAAVLTTARLSLPEVGGDAVAYCEPDAAGIAEVLGALLNDPARRAQLAAAGLSRSALFSWEACARSHLEVFGEAAGRTGGDRRG